MLPPDEIVNATENLTVIRTTFDGNKKREEA